MSPADWTGCLARPGRPARARERGSAESGRDMPKKRQWRNRARRSAGERPDVNLWPTGPRMTGRYSAESWSKAEIFQSPDGVFEKQIRSLNNGTAALTGMNPVLPDGSRISMWVGVGAGAFAGAAG